MTVQCILCADEAEFIGVGECNHQPICYRCIYKMRVISKNNHCPICKMALKNVIIMPDFSPYATIKASIIPDRLFADVFHLNEASRNAFEKLTEFKCFVKIDGKPCKVDKKFPSVAFLKKHLKEDHNRYVCQICVQKKTCVLQQQKLYTFKALNRHLEKGDIDQFGNVTFMHPYCKFCAKYFFDEDEFRVHINLEHMTCNVCGKQQKYRYYKNYDSLETHYKISHYICNDENCLAKKFIAFRNAEELKVHRMQVHDKYSGKKIDMRQLCGFQYEGHNPDDQIIVIKDNQGVDMEGQFLNLKKCKNKALGEADQQEDAILDPRVFYQCAGDEDEHFEEAFILKHRREDRPQTSGPQKKKKYVSKQQLQKQKPTIAIENQHFYFQEISLIHSLHLPKLSYEQFQSKLKTILSSEDIAKLNTARSKMNKKQLKPPEFFEEFLRIMNNVSLKSAYNIFPHFLRTVTNDEIKQELDSLFIRQIKKIPSKNDCLLLKCEQYSDLFKTFLRQIEINIESRIRTKKLNIKKPIKRGKERQYQIIGVVRRLKIQEMARFKYAPNFGVHKDTVEYVLNHIFKKREVDIQERLGKVENEELLDLYIFVKFCLQSIKHSKTMHIEKNKIHQQILEDFLFERPQLEKQFGLKKEELKNLEEQIQYEKLQEERKAKQTLKEIQKKNQLKGFQIKTDFNLVDKGDFPDLVAEKKEETKKEEKFKEVIMSVKEKPATYQKKINEMFPTLGAAQESFPSPGKQETKKEQPVQKPVPKQQEKSWWQKLNQPNKKIELDEQEGERVRHRKGKKKQKWVSVKGIFN